MSFSIVIPLYNERDNIESLINEILTFVKSEKNNFEIILVNDCSTDDTKIIINNLKKKYSDKILIINNEINLGQSYSLIKGIQLANFSTIVTLDGDGQNNPNDINELISIYNKDAKINLVGGIRVKRKDNIIKVLSSKLANKLRKSILQDDCVDTGCSLKVFNREIFLQLPSFKGLHRFLPALFKGYGHKTYFTEVGHRERLHGKSNYGTFMRLINGIIDLIRVYIIINRYKK
jgi:dolichol-phosphate mannosyltransferase